jgi:hypothetical protein
MWRHDFQFFCDISNLLILPKFHQGMQFVRICLIPVFQKWVTFPSSVKKFPSFITVFKTSRRGTLSQTSWIQSKTTYLISYFLDLPCGLFSSAFSTKMLYAFLLSPVSAACPAHLIVPYFITLIFGKVCRYVILFHSLVTSCLSLSLSVLIIPLSTMLNICSSLRVKDQVSHPYKTAGKSLFTFLGRI